MKTFIRLSFIFLNNFLQTCVKKIVPHLPEASPHVTDASKVSFLRTQKCKLVCLEFLLYRDLIKICASLFVLYDK